MIVNRVAANCSFAKELACWCGRDGRTDSRRDAGATLNGVPTEAISQEKAR